MSLPVGVSTFTMSFGKTFDVVGAPVATTIEVVPSHTLIWAATGDRVLPFSVSSAAAEGEFGTITLPHTDQAGFIDATGNTITDWWYTVTVRDRRGTSAGTPARKRVQVTSDIVSVDLDLIPEDTIVGPVGSVPLPPVTSVNGQTGAVVVSGGGGGGGVELVNTVAAASGAVTLPGITTATVHVLTLTGNVTLQMPTVPAGAVSLTVVLKQDGTGGRSVTWPASIAWPGGDAPTLDTAAGGSSVLVLFTTNAGASWIGLLSGTGITAPAEPPPATAPGTPTSFALTPDANSIVVSWAAPANGGSPLTNYKVYRGTVSGSLTLYQTVSAAALTYDDTTVTPGTAYFYRVSAVNAVGEGAQAAEQSATVAAGATLIASDDFNRANTTTGAGLASDGVHTWQMSAANIFNVQNNKGAKTGGDASDYPFIETGESDVAVEATWDGGTWGGLLVRSSGGFLSDGFRFIVTGSDNVQVQGPGMSNLDIPVSMSAGKVLRVEALGSNWTVKVDGVTVGTFTNSSGATNTKHGFAFPLTNFKPDNFKVYAL